MTACEPDDLDLKDAAEDMFYTRRALRHAGCRKGVDDTDVPAEIWRILTVVPRDVFSRTGIGGDKNDIGRNICVPIMRRIEDTLAVSRATRRLPIHFNLSRC